MGGPWVEWTAWVEVKMQFIPSVCVCVHTNERTNEQGLLNTLAAKSSMVKQKNRMLYSTTCYTVQQIYVQLSIIYNSRVLLTYCQVLAIKPL